MTPISEDLVFEKEIAGFSPSEQFLARQMKGVRESIHEMRGIMQGHSQDINTLRSDLIQLKNEHDQRTNAGADCTMVSINGKPNSMKAMVVSGASGGGAIGAIAGIAYLILRMMGILD